MRHALATCTSPTHTERSCCFLCGHCALFPDCSCNDPSKHIAQPLTMSVATWHKRPVSPSDSKIGWRCSQAIPDGPGAAPLRALRKLRRNFFIQIKRSLWNSPCDFKRQESRPVDGRRSPFLNSFNVLLLPGINQVDSKACRVTSFRMAKFSACNLAVTVLTSLLADSCRCSLTGNVPVLSSINDSIVLRRTTRTRLPTFSVRGRGRRASILAPASAHHHVPDL